MLYGARRILYVRFVLGATRTEDVKELIYARQSVVVHAKAYGLQAIDMVYINFKGISHTHKLCQHSRRVSSDSALL